MNKNKLVTFTKYLFTLIVFSSLLLNVVPKAKACGQYRTEILFSFDVRPENLKEFASGNIGILRPKYARSYLVIAYRVLNDLPLTKEQQKQAVKLWNYRLGIGDTETYQNDVKTPTVQERWSNTRNKVLGGDEDSISANEVWKSHSNEFNYYVNCTASGFETATKTLKGRLAKYPDETENIKVWINGQDAVFSNCSGMGQMPNSVAVDAPQWLKKDRAYQVAAASFYAGKFDKALETFGQIAKDDSSAWNTISNYLIARTYLRMASLNKSSTETFNKKAESHLLSLMKNKDMKEVHGISRQLLYTTANRLRTEERFHNFSENLSSQTEIVNMRSEVDIYTNYMDRFGFKPTKKERIVESNTKIADQNESAKKAEPTFLQWLWTWLFGEEKPKEINKAKTKIAVKSANITEEDVYYDYNNEQLTLKNSMHFSSEIDFKNITEIALLEDISAWIFALQSNDKKAFEYSLEKWQKTLKKHWLIAAISNAEVEYEGIEKLVKQANKIKFDSPAFSTVKYHQVRLLIEQDKFDVSRTKLDEFLKSNKNELPLSTHNSFLSQRMLVARNLDEFLKFAQRKTIAYSSYSFFHDETSEIGNYGMDTRDRGMLKWRNRWMFDTDSIEIFNKKMPLKMLMQAGLKKDVPKYLRKGILISALTRAILLENDTTKRKIAKDLINLAPEMSKELYAFFQDPNHLETFKLLINYPVMQPLVDKGFGRFIIPSNSLAYDRDNWWNREELDIKKGYFGKPIIPNFLSENDLQIAEIERKKLFDKGHSGEILSEKAILAAKKFPDEKKLPQLLYKTLQANRYGDNGGENRKNTRSVFQTLHKRFPKSIWTKRSPIWH